MLEKQSISNLFTPYPKQLEYMEAIFSDKYSFLCYGGAMGGGKSYVGLATLILLCKIHPNSKWIVVRESLPTLKRTSLETFKKVLPTNFLASYNQSTQTAIFKNGSQIEFMAEDWEHDKDFDRFKGIECNGFLLEQIEELNEGILDVCFIRAGRHKIPTNPHPIVLANVNPTQNWAKTKIYDRYQKGDMPEDWFYIPATIFDNPILAEDKTYMDKLSNLDPLTYKRLVEGDWSAFNIDNAFAFCFQEHKHVEDVVFDPEHELMLSFDFNVNPITCLAAQHIDEELRIIKAFKLPHSNIYDLCDKINIEYGKYNPLYTVTGDATGRATSALTVGNINYYTVIKQKLNLVGSQLKVPTKNPARKDSSVLVNSMLTHYKIVIDGEECKDLIWDMKYVEVDSEGEINKKSRNNEAQKADLMDCFIYLVHTFFPKYLKYYSS